MVGTQEALGAAAGAAGYLVGQRFVPNIPILGNFTDLAVGAGAVALGMATKQKLIVAFGIGMAIEGAMVAIGL